MVEGVEEGAGLRGGLAVLAPREFEVAVAVEVGEWLGVVAEAGEVEEGEFWLTEEGVEGVGVFGGVGGGDGFAGGGVGFGFAAGGKEEGKGGGREEASVAGAVGLAGGRHWS